VSDEVEEGYENQKGEAEKEDAPVSHQRSHRRQWLAAAVGSSIRQAQIEAAVADPAPIRAQAERRGQTIFQTLAARPLGITGAAPWA
jgi:hypothetical protein